MIQPVDLGVCRGYEYAGDPARTAVVLPGAMLGGMPANAFAIAGLQEAGWRVVQVWDEWDGSDRPGWARARAEAALEFAGEARLLAGKSLGSLAAPVAAELGLAAVWLTPLFHQPPFPDALRARSAPALVIGGTDDPEWDGRAARELASNVLELDGADHALARPEHLPAIVEAVASFSAGLGA